MTKKINVGLIGLGYIGKIHTIAYRDIPFCFPKTPVVANLVAVLRSRLDSEAEAMESFANATTDPAEFYAQPLDMVDICSPNHLHRQHAQHALESGLAVYCEKPLACTLEDARAMADLVERTGALTQVAFVLRYLPAIRQMKALIAAGEIGEVFHFRGRMFHGSYLDYDRPMSWRLRRAEAGGGAWMDLGAHLVDLTHYLLGNVATVRAVMRIFICERCTTPGSDIREPVDVDDWAQCTLELSSGAVGVLEVTRMAAGAEDATDFEVYGSKGALLFQAGDPNFARLYDLKRQQWIRGAINLPPIPGERPIEHIWPSSKYSQGYMTNAHLAAAYDFLLNVAERKPSQVDFRAGAAAQEVIEAAYISAAHGGESIRLPL
ncbi:MAG: Gfo/Idh/MocA family oxidoreductase [Chloroflexi bacterium]|nr:Gfo/Idh/MocA family oxidoreductase [Chloroflexota bacterium]